MPFPRSRLTGRFALPFVPREGSRLFSASWPFRMHPQAQAA